MVALLFIFVFCVSCEKQNLDEGDIVAEDMPALINLSLAASFENDGLETRVEVPNENKFKAIRVFIFDSNGRVSTNYSKTYEVPEVEPKLSLTTISGNNCEIYVVANEIPQLTALLNRISSREELNQISFTWNDFLESKRGNNPLLMTGAMEEVTIHPRSGATNAHSISLTFAMSKLSITVKDLTPPDHGVQLLGWDFAHIQEQSHLTNQSNDYNTTYPEKSSWLSSNQAFGFDKIESVGNKSTAYLTYYFFENRREWRVNRPLPNANHLQYPNMNFTDTDARGKTWFAPKKGTHVIIHGLHTTPTESKAIEAKIYLGADNHSSYNVFRGDNYNFTVTIYGIDEIDIDTNIDHINSNLVVQSSAPLDRFDAHADFRPLQLSGIDCTASIEILDSNGRRYDDPNFDATWVKLSPLNLMHHQVKQAGNNGAWQQSGPVGSFVRSKYIPHKSVRAKLQETGGWNPVPAGLDNDDELTLANATHRMCYKITDITFQPEAVTSLPLYIYADEFIISPSSGVFTRTASIKVLYIKDGLPEARTLNIKQHLPVRPFSGVHYESGGLLIFNEHGFPSIKRRKFTVERFEEAAMVMNPLVPENVQKTEKMQWGFSGTQLYTTIDRFRNGYYSTANAVYTNTVRNPVIEFADLEVDFDGNGFRNMYGNGIIHSNTIPVPYNGSHSGHPYYYPDPNNDIYHPIYKTSASRYCHEKNRDINGDGLISQKEAEWYLPSVHELMLLWISKDGLGLGDMYGDYWSSTEEREPQTANEDYLRKQSWYVNFSGGKTFMQDLNTFDPSKETPRRVRCVRKYTRS
jgi:hypothetical protein